MAITDIPIFSMLRTTMQWHQQRQRLLAENVANADTPNFRPRDLAEPDFDRTAPAGGVNLVRTNAAHILGAGAGAGTGQFESQDEAGLKIQPGGNAVSLEDEMMKVAANQMDYQAVSALYARSLNMLKTAIGKA